MQRITRNANVTVLVVVVISLAAAPMLLPSDTELGSHLLSDNAQTEARHYLEAALRGQGKQQAVVVPLAKIYGEQGRHEEALDLLRQLQNTGPEISVMRRGLLRRSGRLLTYVEDLERQRAPEPGPRELEELARLYGAQQLVELRLNVLLRLRETRPNSLQLGRQVAQLHLRLGDKSAALGVMRELWSRSPTSLTREDFLLLASLSIELDPSDVALALVDTHVDGIGRPGDRVTLARLMAGVGRFHEAAALLDVAMNDPRASADTIDVWALAQIALGQTATAYARLRARADSVSARTTRLLCNLALRQRDDVGALRIGGRADFVGLDDSTLLGLAGAAVRQRSKARLRHILARISEQALRDDAVATAHMYWSVGDKRTALQWASEAAAQEHLTRDQRLWLAELYLQARRPREVARQMRAAGSAGGAPVSALRVALMWWRAKAAKDGLQTWPQGDRGVQVRAGRALLVAAVGRPRDALRLLRGQRDVVVRLIGAERRGDARGGAKEIVSQWLQGLAAEAEREKYRPLSAWVLAELVVLTPDDRTLRLALAQTQLAAGQTGEAWATIQRLPAPRTRREAVARRQILLAAYRAKLPVRETLITEAVTHIAALDLRGAEAQSWVHLLLEAGGATQARPFVDRLAATGSQPWQSRRIALLTELGDHATVLAWWRERGADAKLAAPQRLHAANQLLALKDRASALATYQSVATAEGPAGPTVAQLLHLWGPRPGPAAIAWLTERAKAARGATEAAWLRHLLWVNAGTAVRALVGRNPPEGPLLDVAIEALVATRDYDALGTLVRRRLPKLRSEATVRRLAQLCSAHSQRAAAVASYERLVQLRPRDGEAMRFLAQAKTGAIAAGWWQRLFDLPLAQRPPEIWQDRAAFGELLIQSGRRMDGLQQLRVALRLANAAPAATRLEVRGRLLMRLGRAVEASAALERALRGRPCDDRLRADLVSALMAARQLEKARSLVDPPLTCRQGGLR